MKRLLATAAAVSVIGLPLASISFAPAAEAITNPAQNPHPITVKGDDGNTYTDGADTLPGYDDEACTYIPGAWFDFDNNRVHYADGQSIAWTEWDRATGYADWKAKHDKPTAPSSAKPTSPSTPKAASSPSSKPSTGGGASGGTSKSSHHSTATSPASAGATTVPSAGAATSAAPTGTASPTGTATAAPTEAASQAAVADATTTSTEAGAPVTDASPSATTTDARIADVAADTSSSSISGFAIIGGLVAVAALLLGGNAVYRRSRKESVQ